MPNFINMSLAVQALKRNKQRYFHIYNITHLHWIDYKQDDDTTEKLLKLENKKKRLVLIKHSLNTQYINRIYGCIWRV